MEDLLTRRWQLEEPDEPELADMDECEYVYKTTTKREPDGRYMVQIPFKSSTQIGHSYHQALRQLEWQERRCYKQEELQEKYVPFMREYMALGHMSPVESQLTDGRRCTS